MAQNKARLDRLLVERGLADSRQRAVALILAGKVRVAGQQALKAGQRVSTEIALEVLDQDETYVSRGGHKLAGALDSFALQVADVVAIDVGASTGGFTDCLLQRGAKRIYAVDVGYGQLAWELRQDQRVIVIERTNIRHMPDHAIPETVDLITIDVSFISLKIVVPAVIRFLKPDASILALIKPQFEVGKGQVGKGGVVRDPQTHQKIISELANFFRSIRLSPQPAIASPLLGPRGNREFFIFLQRQ